VADATVVWRLRDEWVAPVPFYVAACESARMEETHMMWAMVMIGTGIASAGGAGLFLPVGQRLSIALTLVLGAGTGVASLFLLMLARGIDHPRAPAQAFLIASAVGLASLLAGLAVLFRRARSS
jgi:hypothetical protein